MRGMPLPFFHLTFLLILVVSSPSHRRFSLSKNDGNAVSKTIVVDQSGRGDFTTVQADINAVPEDDAAWIQILVRNDGSLEIAAAAYAGADQVSFYQCSFIGLQDTLTDIMGSYHFKSCYIEGIVDFIWSGVCQDRTINATEHVLPPGLSRFITAQARDSVEDKNGYVFIGVCVVGTRTINLGQVYRRDSRVVFKLTFFSNVVQPQGWSAWNCVGPE